MARRGEGGARKLLGIEPERRPLRRILSHRQRARHRLGRDVVAETGDIVAHRLLPGPRTKLPATPDLFRAPTCRKRWRPWRVGCWNKSGMTKSGIIANLPQLRPEATTHPPTAITPRRIWSSSLDSNKADRTSGVKGKREEVR